MMEKGHTIQVHDHGYVRYIDHMGTDQRIVESARISYKSPSKGDDQDRKLLGYLMRNQHWTPYESCQVTFNVKLPIFVMRQWVRHRSQHLNELSARYTQLPDECYVPDVFREQSKKNKQSSTLAAAVDQVGCRDTVTSAYTFAYNAYTNLLAMGVAREQARIVLPVGIYTEIYSTWDLRNLLHFFRLRDDSHAQAEIQDYARAMKVIAEELFPWTMEFYKEVIK